MLNVTLVGLGVIMLLLWIYNKRSRPKGYPPGPFVFPVFGSFPLIALSNTPFFGKLRKWRKEYGNIYSLGLGTFRVVFLHDVEVIREAFNNPKFNGRELLEHFRLVAGEQQRGLSVSQGEQWAAQRQFALKNLRDLGFGKSSMEAIVHEGIVELLDGLKKEATPIVMAHRLQGVVINGLWTILTGDPFSQNDPEPKRIIKNILEAVAQIQGGGAILFLPWLMKLIPSMTGWSTLTKAMPETKKFIQKYIEHHKMTLDDKVDRDYMDVYLKKIKSTTDPNSSFYGKAGDENMRASMVNLLGAGSGPTSNTLSWTLLYLSKYPEIQAKVQKEIDEVIGNSRLPVLNDRQRMPYISAVILEVFRKSSLVPLGMPHKTMEDVELLGYRIPKNTIVFANLFEVHHSEQIWKDPWSFRPERFLTAEGEIDKDHPAVVPFSVGKRQCLGESLARNNVFLFMVSIFQSFVVQPDEEGRKFNIARMPAGDWRLPPPQCKYLFQHRGTKAYDIPG